MDTSFLIIDKFLSNYGPEVEGRSAGILTPELREQLTKLGRGELGVAERQLIAKELLANPAAMEFLVAEVKGKA